MKHPNAATLNFIATHREENPTKLAFQAGKPTDVDLTFAIQQIAARQAMRDKLPTWAATDGLFYPPHISLEQCSSEWTARYKASLVRGTTLLDLTGGFGIDCAFLSASFAQTTYVEQQQHLCAIATHNFAKLGLTSITVSPGDAVEHLSASPVVDTIYLDPARRSEKGAKCVAISDCTPDISQLAPLLLQKARSVLVKLSPMLDATLALRELQHVAAVHIVSTANECKELLLLFQRDAEMPPTFYAVNKPTVGAVQRFSFTLEQEQAAVCSYTAQPARYLYEPNASLLKAGCFKLLATRFAMQKLHPNTHLYTSDTYCKDFPGRHFEVLQVSSFNKKELKQHLREISQANLTVRNFPSSVQELRKRLHLKEGGSHYLFATTLNDERKVLLTCRKA